MKSIFLSTTTILLVVTTVMLGSIYLSGTLRDIETRLDTMLENSDKTVEERTEDISAIYSEFKRKEGLLSLMLGDALLSDIERGFLDAISYAESGNGEETLVAVTRLANDIENARKLAELSIMSVF